MVTNELTTSSFIFKVDTGETTATLEMVPPTANLDLEVDQSGSEATATIVAYIIIKKLRDI